MGSVSQIPAAPHLTFVVMASGCQTMLPSDRSFWDSLPWWIPARAWRAEVGLLSQHVGGDLAKWSPPLLPIRRGGSPAPQPDLADFAIIPLQRSPPLVPTTEYSLATHSTSDTPGQHG